MNFQSIKDRIHGPVFSIVTPFLANDEVDFEALEANIEDIHNAGGKKFYVMAYNSRYSELSWDEIKKLNAFVSKKVKALSPDNIMIVADPLHCTTKVTIDFAEHAKSVGADVISLINREKYYSNSQIYNHFAAVAKQVDIGILIHEMPFLSGYGGPPVNYPLELLTDLADIDNVVAVKEDAKEDTYSKKVINSIKDRVQIVISGGGKRQWLQFADDGCQAWLNGIGVFEPALAVKFYEHYQAGNKAGYMDIVNEIEVPFFEKGIKRFGWHLTIKAAMEALGSIKRHERLPLQALNDADAAEVRALMESLPIKEILSRTYA